MPLTAEKIRAAAATDKSLKLYDGGGLLLLVTPEGHRWWRLKYRFGGKERSLSLGVYPDVPLSEARDHRDDAKALLRRGIDPSAARQAKKITQGDTLKAVAEEWLELRGRTLSHVTIDKNRWMLTDYVFPRLGTKPMTAIKPPELLAALKVIESRGLQETAIRTKQCISQIYRYAISSGRAERDITADLRGALAPATTKNRAAITDPAQVGALLRAIDGYIGQPVTHAALRFAPLVFVRPGELRAARWTEFELEAKEPVWRIPGQRMKMKELHIVPLSTQAVAILEALQPLTGIGPYVFPSLRSRDRCMSENTVNAALRRLGYDKHTMTGHGFRAMASTLLNEQGFAPDVIELQLAHQERNKVRAAYNRAQRLAERRRMLQAWSDYLEGLKAGAKVVTLKRSA
ncbi:MAG TPA: integrase arm-type DNA-binding domain-containing protein [Steroidobacteraceae bacterium]|jgi:integrase|nr:integrase arm-type DNA-binding domain-containing protein [Steroidobacteraceae bacterium]